MDIEKLQETARRFIDERDWRQFQTLKELAINASVESNELLELFQWQEGKDIDKKLLSGEDKATMDKIKKETADVFFSCLAIADVGVIAMRSKKTLDGIWVNTIVLIKPILFDKA